MDADLKSYFDTLPQERLLALVKERVADGRVLALLEKFLRAGVWDGAKGWQPTQRGTPQGGVISPLWANIYLNGLDHLMEQEGWERVRYAVEKFKDRVREKTPRMDGRSVERIITDVNRTLRGWYGYFQHRKANVFKQVDG